MKVYSNFFLPVSTSSSTSGELGEAKNQNCNVASYIVVTAIIAAILTAITVVCIMIVVWYCISKRNKCGGFYLKDYKPKPSGATEKNGDVEI